MVQDDAINHTRILSLVSKKLVEGTTFAVFEKKTKKLHEPRTSVTYTCGLSKC